MSKKIIDEFEIDDSDIRVVNGKSYVKFEVC